MTETDSRTLNDFEIETSVENSAAQAAPRKIKASAKWHPNC